MLRIEVQRNIKLSGQEANDFMTVCDMAAAYIKLVEAKKVPDDQTTATQRAAAARLIRQVKMMPE